MGGYTANPIANMDLSQKLTALPSKTWANARSAGGSRAGLDRVRRQAEAARGDGAPPL
jgi:hypothetical protein